MLVLYVFLSSFKTGGYDKEEKAARAYDLAALKYWGPTTHINFPVSLFQQHFCIMTLKENNLFFFFFDIRLCSHILCIQLSTYEKELEEMKNMTRQEFVAHLRRLVLKR